MSDRVGRCCRSDVFRRVAELFISAQSRRAGRVLANALDVAARRGTDPMSGRPGAALRLACVASVTSARAI